MSKARLANDRSQDRLGQTGEVGLGIAQCVGDRVAAKSGARRAAGRMLVVAEAVVGLRADVEVAPKDEVAGRLAHHRLDQAAPVGGRGACHPGRVAGSGDRESAGLPGAVI